ncbi:hypothetical protein evm_007693 [Chilo suppressalis]|nr:hypothetical protein evm_007693 [Chilo suppressalis]
MCLRLLFCVLIVVDSVKQGDNLNNNKLTRVKRERWIWGYADVTRTDRGVHDEPISFDNRVHEETNPCFPLDYPPTPNFNAPGRRISQVKCYEYMYTMKIISEEAERQKECENLLLDIIGGKDASPREFPHMAAIGWKATDGQWAFKCGGSLISSKFVLTAAHCSRASNRDGTIAEEVPQIVRLGTNKINRPESHKDATILRIITHPNYTPPRKYFDIALIQLERGVQFTESIQPACLYTGPDDGLVGQKATLSGWGVLDLDRLTTPTQLQAAEVDILDSVLCDRIFRRSCSRLWCGMERNQICAGKLEGGVDACQGDSGGPLQIKTAFPNGRGQLYRLLGVTSFGIGCAQPNLPGIYTRVSSFIDWIEAVVWN